MSVSNLFNTNQFHLHAKKLTVEELIAPILISSNIVATNISAGNFNGVNNTLINATITTENVTTSNIATANIVTGNITTLDSTNGTIDNLTSTTATIDTLNTTTLTLDTLDAINGDITNLVSDNSIIDNMTGNFLILNNNITSPTGNIDDLAAQNIATQTLSADDGNIINLTVGTLNSTTINNSGVLSSGSASIPTIGSTTITNVGTLTSGVVNGTSGTITTINSTTSNNSGTLTSGIMNATSGRITTFAANTIDNVSGLTIGISKPLLFPTVTGLTATGFSGYSSGLLNLVTGGAAIVAGLAPVSYLRIGSLVNLYFNALTFTSTGNSGIVTMTIPTGLTSFSSPWQMAILNYPTSGLVGYDIYYRFANTTTLAFYSTASEQSFNQVLIPPGIIPNGTQFNFKPFMVSYILS